MAPTRKEQPIGPHRTAFVAINVAGGLAVLGSYAHGLMTHPELRDALWGGVPESLRPLYTASMLLAAVGYFAFTGFLLLRVDAGRVRVFGRFGFGLFSALYACVLAGSALWMPLTFRMLRAPDDGLWLAIRLVLAVVGLASLALLAALVSSSVDRSGAFYKAAVAGLVAFCVQTALLDALVWPAFFPA